MYRKWISARVTAYLMICLSSRTRLPLSIFLYIHFTQTLPLNLYFHSSSQAHESEGLNNQLINLEFSRAYIPYPDYSSTLHI